MAGRGPAPGANPNRKPADQRRSNTVDHFDDLPAEGYQGEYPPLPQRYRIGTEWNEEEEREEAVFVDYLPETREWYETWARSPMAVRFTAVDWRRLAMIAPLRDEYNRGPSVKLASELRLQESLLGATVMDRQRLAVKVVNSSEAEKPKAKKAAVDRKTRLRAVS